MAFLEAHDVHFSYHLEGRDTPVLRGLDLSVDEGELVAIQGSSGSGKSTLLYVLGGLLSPGSGQVRIDGQNLYNLSDLSLAWVRNKKIGFVFQQFHLLPRASVVENILLPARYPAESAVITPEKRERAVKIAEQLGLGSHLENQPNQLSGGQQQRVAVGRALMNDARLILADEPTGNLDSVNAAQTLELLKKLNRQGRTVIIITHDPEIARQCPRVIRIKDGKFEAERAILPAHGRVAMDKSQKVIEIESPTIGFWRSARALLPLAWANLGRNRGRSVLTMLGITIGIAAVLSMITLGKFTKRRILETYESLGVNKISIWGYTNWELQAKDRLGFAFRDFDVDKDLMPLKRVFPEVQRVSPVMHLWGMNVSFGSMTVTNKVGVYGVATDYFEVTNSQLQIGQAINPYQVESRSSVCVIGSEIVQRLFANVSPLGQIVYLAEGDTTFACKVIGVLKPRSSNQDWDHPNSYVLLPYTAIRQLTRNEWQSRIHNASLQVSPNADVEVVSKKVKKYFEHRYGKSGKFGVESDAMLIAQMKKFLSLFTVLLAGIAMISLLVGGIGIMNMMLVSVSERVKEIGLRKALGATNRSVRQQFLIESVVLCALAGVTGLLIGFITYEAAIFGATQVVAKLKFEWIFDPWAAGLSVAAIVVVGLASGLVPAMRAEKLEVIEALRSE